MLRFLLDEHISPTVCSIVRERRSEILIESLLEWRDGGLRGKDDDVVLTAAAETEYALATYDLYGPFRHSYRRGLRKDGAIRGSSSLTSALAGHRI